MKIQILSDLHLEFAAFDLRIQDADVLILAGDTDLGSRGIAWVMANVRDIPVLYVLGNHEYYGHSLPKLVTELREATQGSNISILENDKVIIDDVEFLGCTLWTDFRLFGEDPKIAGIAVQQAMMDYRKIRVSPGYSKLRSIDTAMLNAKSVSWMKQQGTATAKKRVVITHHAPSRRSVPDRFQNDSISAGYASNLDELVVNSGAKLWIHGHIHDPVDYLLGDTRVISNPRGYPGEVSVNFNDKLVIEI